MPLQNDWVTYTTRGYNDIKTSVLNRLGIKVPELTDHSESNVMVIIISMFAGVAEMLSYYIDNMAREAFISTARKFSSMVKLVNLIDYRIKAANPSDADLTLTFDAAATGAFTILAGTEFATTNGLVWLSVQDVIVNIGDQIVQVGVEQKVQVLNQSLGTTSGLADQAVIIGTDYVDASMILEVGGTPWELVNTFGFSGPLDTHYIIEISSDKIAYLKFGDGINGAIPTTAQQIDGDYYTTSGVEGNVGENNITTIVTTLTIPGVTSIEATNILKTVAGYGYEDIERIRRNAPLSLRTLDRAVTRADYRDVALQATGVEHASIHFDCGKHIDIYISPIGGGIAQSPLLQATCAWTEQRKMITTFLNCEPAGETYISLELDVTAKFRMDAAQTELDIRAALLDAYSFDNSDINKPVRRSDIIALVDNLNKVDFLRLISITTIPYARPDAHIIELVWDRVTGSGSTATVEWRLNYDGAQFRLYMNQVFISNIAVGAPYIDPTNSIEFTINAAAYIAGMDWNFKTYAYNENIELDDFSVPILRDQDLTLTINEQLTIN
jgi:hypothetical protein